MRITIFIQQLYSNDGIVFFGIRTDINYFIISEFFTDLFLKFMNDLSHFYFKMAGIIGCCFHLIVVNLNYCQRISAEAQVNPLPKAAKQIKSSFFILPSAQASLMAIGIDAAVVFP